MVTPAYRAAVVGGAGAIGHALTERLVASARAVVVIDVKGAPTLPGAEYQPGDVRDAASLTSAIEGADVVYNLAAAHGLDVHPPEVYRSVNVEGARSLCRAATDAGVTRIVFTSSAAVYGDTDGPDESRTCRPTGDYAESKLAAEAVYREWQRERTGRRLTIVRPTVIFGPGADGAGNRLLRRIAAPDFALVDGGVNRKSLAFIDNVAAFLEFVGALDGPHDLFNYCDLPDLSLAALERTVRSELGLASAPTRSRLGAYAAAAGAALVTPQTGASRRAVASSVKRLFRDLRFDATRAHASGFRQPVALAEGLVQTVRSELAWVSLVTKKRGVDRV